MAKRIYVPYKNYKNMVSEPHPFYDRFMWKHYLEPSQYGGGRFDIVRKPRLFGLIFVVPVCTFWGILKVIGMGLVEIFEELRIIFLKEDKEWTYDEEVAEYYYTHGGDKK